MNPHNLTRRTAQPGVGARTPVASSEASEVVTHGAIYDGTKSIAYWTASRQDPRAAEKLTAMSVGKTLDTQGQTQGQKCLLRLLARAYPREFRHVHTLQNVHHATPNWGKCDQLPAADAWASSERQQGKLLPDSPKTSHYGCRKQRDTIAPTNSMGT